MRGEIQVGFCSCSCPVPLLKKTVQSCLPSAQCNNGVGGNRQLPPAHSLCGHFTASVAGTVQCSAVQCTTVAALAHMCFHQIVRYVLYCAALYCTPLYSSVYSSDPAPHRLLALRQRRIQTLNDDADASRTSSYPFAALSTKKTCEKASQQSRCWSNEDRCFHSIVQYHQLAAG